MAPRTTTRSQRTLSATQSNRIKSHSKGTHRGRNVESDDEEIGEDVGRGDDDGDIGSVNSAEAEIKRKANDLVRLALFTEQRRVPLRREDITKKVLGPNTRAFNHVFDRAQTILQQTFGMELIELQTRAGLEADAANVEDQPSQARNATGVKKKEYAALTDETILEEESADILSDDGDDDDDPHIRSYGSLISWSSSDQLGAVGILYTILALILVNGRTMSDMELRAQLKNLGLPPSGHVTFSAQSTHKTLPVETYLATLIRQGYLDRTQVGDIKKGGKGKGAKRARVTQADEESGTTYEWRWGSRAQSEVGEKGVAKFIAEFMVGDAGDDDDDDDATRGRHEEAGAKLERMVKGVERAAGGQLADIK
ncbi:hypothetical protein H0H81_012602 [Sphagnurus paluster]|uniref:MAGE domain-containing protein n=1 Tax=Sphagnurus paluster TaxID=117069 RepID=A0A9P7GJA2_9AGAR|nr:hypothetical protein H0H81_012602 [Sphagnurus paluster]